MALIDDLKTARERAGARLAEVLANPKPSYSADGKTVQWAAYTNMLTETINRLDSLIAGKESPGFSQIQGHT